MQGDGAGKADDSDDRENEILAYSTLAFLPGAILIYYSYYSYCSYYYYY